MNAIGGALEDCRASLVDGILTLENSRLTRTYRWNEGHLIGVSLTDRQNGFVWDLAGETADCSFPGQDDRSTHGALGVTPVAATAVRPAHLRVDATTSLGSLRVRRRFRITPGCPAITCDLYLRGAWTRPAVLPASTFKERIRQHEQQRGAATLDRLCVLDPHLRLDCVRFRDITDLRNTLVETRSILSYRFEASLAGNLLFLRRVLDGAGMFVLKEAPCSEEQLAWPGADFCCKLGEVRTVGIGIEPPDLDRDRWTRGYGTVVGIARGTEFDLLAALRAYQDLIRVHRPDRDEMILLNTWGDRGQDTRIGETFALAELDRAARLGITHFQLDDGWQVGRSSNSAFAGGSLEGIWRQEGYWAPHPERFPRGLGPVAERSRELGIELCVWFNPSKDNSYAHWREDADVLIGLYRAHGIRTFKIDGVEVPDKEADRNLRAMLEWVTETTDGQAAFNMDVTAGRRWGYHYGNEYGNIFLENRYTDWSNYYPHWTLRNLWMLARYVPAQKLQTEFLNRWRNADRYPADDPLAPQRVPFEYCFAVTAMAQPLAWFEATGLPEEALDLGATIVAYRLHQQAIHEGLILPVGEEPSGVSWTGFQSSGEGRGYLIVYRELNDRPSAMIRLWNLAGETIRCRAIIGQGSDFESEVGADGTIDVALPGPLTYALYAYEVT